MSIMQHIQNCFGTHSIVALHQQTEELFP